MSINHFVRCYFLRCIVRLTGLSLLFLLFSPAAFAQGFPSTVLKVADEKSSEPISTEQINEWIIQVKNGDWMLGSEFAAAYLRSEDCEKLPYGHRCRAMRANPEVGRKALFDIIDSPLSTDKKDEYKNFEIKAFQLDYALIQREEVWRRTPSGRQRLDPNDKACMDFIKYIELAAENDALCGSREAGDAYYFGICTEKIKKRHSISMGNTMAAQ